MNKKQIVLEVEQNGNCCELSCLENIDKVKISKNNKHETVNVRFNTVRKKISNFAERYALYGETTGWKYDNPLGEASIIYGKDTWVNIEITDNLCSDKNREHILFYLIQFIEYDIILSCPEKVDNIYYTMFGKNYYEKYYSDMELKRSEMEDN